MYDNFKTKREQLDKEQYPSELILDYFPPLSLIKRRTCKEFNLGISDLHNQK